MPSGLGLARSVNDDGKPVTNWPPLVTRSMTAWISELMPSVATMLLMPTLVPAAR